MKLSLFQSIDSPVFSRRRLVNLIWPLIVEQFLAVFVGMVDVLMVAAVGEEAVSGVSLVDAINNLIFQVLFALTGGGTVICARYIGAKDHDGAGRTAAQLILITLSGTTVLTALFLVGGNGLLELIFGKVERGVMDKASRYMMITALSYPFLALYNCGAAAFRASANTRVSMIWSLIINVFNIAGNALCVFVLRMGVEGVAIPTLAARILGAVGIQLTLKYTKNPACIRCISYLRPNRAIIKQTLNIGIPNAIENGIFQFGKVTLTSLVSTLGTPSIAAFAVASNLVNFLYLPGGSLGNSMLTIVGQCCGAGKPEQAKPYAKLLVCLNYALLAILATTLALGRHFFVGLYNLSGEAAWYAQALVLMHCIAMVLWPLAFLIPHYFRAIGKARFTMLVAVSTMWVFRIGLAYVYIGLLHMSVLGAWYAMFVDWIARVIIYIIAFRRERVPSVRG